MFKFKPSRLYCFLIGLFFIPGLVMVLFLPIHWIMNVGLFLLVAVYGGLLIWEQGLLRGSRVILGVFPLEGKDWLLETRTQTLPGELLGDSTVTAWMLVLRFRTPGSRLAKSCVVFKDALLGDRFYQLKLKAKHSR